MFKKHLDTLVIVGMILIACKWGDAKFTKLNDRLSALEQETAQIKTVLIMRGMMPESLATGE